MNIGIDVSPLTKGYGGGIKSFLFYTLKELINWDTKNNYFLYSAKQIDLPLELPENWHLRRGNGLAAKSNIVWMQTGLNRLAHQDELDFFWGPRYSLPYLLKGVYKAATVFDLFFKFVPESIKWSNRTLDKYLTYLTIKNADKIIATSKATADDLIETYKITSEKIMVLHGGVDFTIFNQKNINNNLQAVKEKYNLGQDYILAIDIYNPRKNFTLTAKAYSRLPERLRHKYRLVGIGSPHMIYGALDVTKLISELKIDDYVTLYDHVSMAEICCFYAEAAVFVFPSLYEGFGLPIIEAMACGCPVITSDNSSMPEAAGDAALLVAADDVEGLSNKLREILISTDLKSEMVGKGMEHSQNFTWANFAKGVIELIDRERINK